MSVYKQKPRTVLVGGAVLLLILVAAAAAWAAGLPADDSRPATAAEGVEQLVARGGIEVVALRRTAGGHFLDFRYRIVDPDKAAVFMNRKAKPVLVDQANGHRLPVPTTAKVGRLRSTNSKPQKGRQYFMLFANPGTYLQAGSMVTLEMGDLKFTDLTIE